MGGDLICVRWSSEGAASGRPYREKTKEKTQGHTGRVVNPRPYAYRRLASVASFASSVSRVGGPCTTKRRW